MRNRVLGATAAILLSAAVLSCASSEASDDFQYWSRLTLKTWEHGKWGLSTLGEIRAMEDGRKAGFYLISEQLSYRWLDHVNLGVNGTYISSDTKTASGTEFKDQQRLELEVSPHWSVSDSLQIKNRNRFEFRWIEDQGSDNPRFRQQWELVFPLKDRMPLRSFFMNNEIFFDLHQDRVSENWCVPAGIDLKISDKVGLKVFYMVQSRKGAVDWSSNQIVGTHVTASF